MRVEGERGVGGALDFVALKKSHALFLWALTSCGVLLQLDEDFYDLSPPFPQRSTWT